MPEDIIAWPSSLGFVEILSDWPCLSIRFFARKDLTTQLNAAALCRSKRSAQWGLIIFVRTPSHCHSFGSAFCGADPMSQGYLLIVLQILKLNIVFDMNHLIPCCESKTNILQWYLHGNLWAPHVQWYPSCIYYPGTSLQTTDNLIMKWPVVWLIFLNEHPVIQPLVL